MASAPMPRFEHRAVFDRRSGGTRLVEDYADIDRFDLVSWLEVSVLLELVLASFRPGDLDLGLVFALEFARGGASCSSSSTSVTM